MFEITYGDRELLEPYIECGKAYKDGKYDLTFEERFLIYHCTLAHRLTYLSIDMHTGQSSQLSGVRATEPVQKEHHKELIPAILRSIRYTGDRRYYNTFADHPLDVIESIFTTIFPQYGLMVRPEQIKLAKEMYLGLTRKVASINEAEVGTGKTLAYLVASLVAKHNNRLVYDTNQPITITTSSIELQRALVEKEIPLLSRMLQDYCIIDRPLTAVLRKGKEHYFCRRRYEELMKNLKRYPEKYEKLIRHFEETDFAGKAFDLDRHNYRPSLKERICVKGACKKCPYADSCRYLGFIRNAQSAKNLDFQVTNHNLYLTSVKLRKEENGNLLQRSNFVVIDEAHKLKDAAESVFGTELLENEIPYYIEQVNPLASTKVSERRYKIFLGEIAIANEQLFESLKKKVNPEDRDEDHGTRIVLNPTEVGFLSRIAETIQEIEQMRRPIPNGMNELGKALLKKLKALCQPSKNSTWLEENEHGTLHLCGVPKNMGKVLYETVWSNQVGHVLTSGTLSDGETFNYFVQEIGLGNISRNRMKITKTPSPFDYEEHTRLYIPKGMPFPATDSDSYLQAIAEQVLSLVEATNGHTAILFTSYKVLSAVYELTKDLLGKYELFCMTRANKTAISDFKKSRNGILFASGSMWEGVDCVGDCLSSVIIPRLPFPLRSALLDQKKDLSPDIQEFIQTYAVPEMLIKLRQGVGRLIRSETDTGLIAILDCRAENGPYAERVNGVLTKYPKTDSVDAISEFFKTVKEKDYFSV